MKPIERKQSFWPIDFIEGFSLEELLDPTLQNLDERYGVLQSL